MHKVEDSQHSRRRPPIFDAPDLSLIPPKDVSLSLSHFKADLLQTFSHLLSNHKKTLFSQDSSDPCSPLISSIETRLNSIKKLLLPSKTSSALPPSSAFPYESTNNELLSSPVPTSLLPSNTSSISLFQNASPFPSSLPPAKSPSSKPSSSLPPPSSSPSDLINTGLSSRLMELAKKHAAIKTVIESNKENLTHNNLMEKFGEGLATRGEELKKFELMAERIEKGFENKSRVIKDQLESKVKLVQRRQEVVFGKENNDSQSYQEIISENIANFTRNKENSIKSNEFHYKNEGKGLKVRDPNQSIDENAFANNSYYSAVERTNKNRDNTPKNNELSTLIDFFNGKVEDLSSKFFSEAGELRKRLESLSERNWIKERLDENATEQPMQDVLAEVRKVQKHIEFLKNGFLELKEHTSKQLRLFDQAAQAQFSSSSSGIQKIRGKIDESSKYLEDQVLKIDRFEPILDSFLQIFSQKPKISRNEDILREIEGINKVLVGLEGNLVEKTDSLEETIISREHFLEKLEKITVKFTQLQSQGEIYQQDLLFSIENLMKPKEKREKVEEPRKVRELVNFVRIPRKIEENEELYGESAEKIPNFGGREEVSPFKVNFIRGGREVTPGKNKSPLWKMEEFEKISSISKPNRLTDLGFGQCEEIGFTVKENGMVESKNGEPIYDSEGNQIQLCPEYIEFLTYND